MFVWLAPASASVSARPNNIEHTSAAHIQPNSALPIVLSLSLVFYPSEQIIVIVRLFINSNSNRTTNYKTTTNNKLVAFFFVEIPS